MPGPAPEHHPAIASPFTLHDGRRVGMSRSRLRASDLERRVFGIRAQAGAFDDVRTRCQMFALRLANETFFSHTTSALLLNAPLPWKLEKGPVHASVPAPQRAPHAKGIVGHSRALQPGDIWTTYGIRHSSPERTWCELGGTLELGDLVALGDHLIHHRASWTTAESLASRMAADDRLGRSRRLHEALNLLDGRSESPQESRLRVLLHKNGLRSAVINRTIVRAEGGRGIRCDLTFANERVVVEYQGDYHRSKSQWRDDMTRRSRLEARGWYVMEVNADDLKHHAELISRIQLVLARQRRLLALEAGINVQGTPASRANSG